MRKINFFFSKNIKSIIHLDFFSFLESFWSKHKKEKGKGEEGRIVLGFWKNGRLGPKHEINPNANPSAIHQGRTTRRSGMDAAPEGGVQGPDRLYFHEQVQGQRLVPHFRRQSGGHTVDRQVLVRPQSPQVWIWPPIRHSGYLSGHRAWAWAATTWRKNSQGKFI